MKVVCIKSSLCLTLGKTYMILEDGSSWMDYVYLIRNDTGQPSWYGKDVLIPIEELRELKLKELGII